jgi:hypothetical protein
MSRSGCVAAAFAAVFLLAACGEAADDATQSTGISLPDATTTTLRSLTSSPLTVVADTEEATVPSSSDIDPSLQPLVDQAVADLAVRLSIDASTIETISASSVTWPDGSLGCPQPGMNYTQVLVDGTKIELAVDGTAYSYHSGGSRSPFLCQKA